MAKDTGRGFRRGTMRSRSQTRNPLTGIWTKRNRATGQFTAGKTSGGRFKGVRSEKQKGQGNEQCNGCCANRFRRRRARRDAAHPALARLAARQ